MTLIANTSDPAHTITLAAFDEVGVA